VSDTIVIVGGGLAAGNAATTLREEGFDGRVVVFAAEPHLPYERPPLSKGYLLGNDPLEDAFVHDEAWYDEHGVDVRTGVEVTRLDTEAHTVGGTDGVEQYDRLLLATGARPRRLALADDSGFPVNYLRTIEDSDALKAGFGEGRRTVVVGGGWIGLEVASAARHGGSEVTVLEALDLPLVRVLGPEVARVFADLHVEHGVDLRTNASLEAVSPDGDRVVCRLGDGTEVTGDQLVVGVGVAPDTSLAESAGLRVDNGILVDEQLRASAPDVFAAGDVANHFHPVLGRRIRVEHWETAIEQGKLAGRNLAAPGAELHSYDRMPYFFTDQYDLGMEYVGSVGPDGYDEVLIQGDTSAEQRQFRAYWHKDGRILAAMQVNDWDASDHIREIVGQPVSAL
jgi:NADPH-dependent 2,4-dienoyl-CoA reductase/sulfur reductase-like enzyme